MNGNNHINGQKNSEINFNLPDVYGHYQIMSAINNDNTSFLEYMISKGADVNIDLGNGWTPLHEAIDAALDEMHQDKKQRPSDEILEIIEILLENGADLNRTDAFGVAPPDLLNNYSNNNYENFIQFKNIFRKVIPLIDNVVVFKPAT